MKFKSKLEFLIQYSKFEQRILINAQRHLECSNEELNVGAKT